MRNLRDAIALGYRIQVSRARESHRKLTKAVWRMDLETRRENHVDSCIKDSHLA